MVVKIVTQKSLAFIKSKVTSGLVLKLGQTPPWQMVSIPGSPPHGTDLLKRNGGGHLIRNRIVLDMKPRPMISDRESQSADRC